MKTKILSDNKFEICLAIIVVTILLFPLFDLPRPATLTGHPWKVELLSSLFLFIVSIVLLVKSSRNKIYSKDNKLLLYLAIPFSIFIIWSGISYFWASSPRSVAHHTFVWINYLLIFVITFKYLQQAKNTILIRYILVGAAIFLFILILSDYMLISDFSISQGPLRVRYAKFAELILITAPVLWAFAFYTKKPLIKNITFVAGVCAWLMPMFSLSKGAFLAGIFSFAVFFVAVFFFSHPRYRRKVLALAGIWLAITVGTQLYYTYSSEISSTVKHFTGDADKSRDSSMFRVFTWKVSLQMIRENWLVGVGADNFGQEVNNSRRNFAKLNPDDPLNSMAEDYYVERSHNEFLQIIAELGIIGFLIFSSIFVVLFYRISRIFIKHRKRLSPMFWGSFAGVIGFFVSSMLSSFSFRAVQNGIMFILVLALMVYELNKIKLSDETPKENFTFDIQKWQKPIFAGLSIILLLSVTNFLTHSISVFNVYFAEQEKDMEIAETYYKRAVFFDRENGSAYLSNAGKLYYSEQYKEAAPMFRKAIENGANVSLTYFYLAKSQIMAGDKEAAKKTLSEAVEIFPHSIYARTHYAILLDENGKQADAEKQFEFAAKLNPKDANSWKIVLEKNILTATLKAEKDKSVQKPNELIPQNVILAIFFDNRKGMSAFSK